jgi:hypothetical protein
MPRWEPDPILGETHVSVGCKIVTILYEVVPIFYSVSYV